MKQFFAFLLCIMLIISGAYSSFAHDDEKHKDSKSRTEIKSEDDKNIQDKGAQLNVAPDEEAPYVVTFPDVIVDHLHNKIVHIPIAFVLLGVIFSLWAFKRPELDIALKILVPIAALAAIGAYFSGQAQEEPFEHGPKEWVLELHEKLGLFVMISLWLWTIVLFIPRLRRFAIIAAIICGIITAIAGFYGGILIS